MVLPLSCRREVLVPLGLGFFQRHTPGSGDGIGGQGHSLRFRDALQLGGGGREGLMVDVVAVPGRIGHGLQEEAGGGVVDFVGAFLLLGFAAVTKVERPAEESGGEIFDISAGGMAQAFASFEEDRVLEFSGAFVEAEGV